MKHSTSILVPRKNESEANETPVKNLSKQAHIDEDIYIAVREACGSSRRIIMCTV